MENEGNTAAIDEERRLCYVGITRAQQRLTFSMALTRMKWGKPRDSTPSRFLFEVTGQAQTTNTMPGSAKPHKPHTRKDAKSKKPQRRRS
jgi:superfamily I DNA/RNA helicase